MTRMGASGRFGIGHMLRAMILWIALVWGGGAARAAELADGLPPLDICAFHPTFVEDFRVLSVSPWGNRTSTWIAHTPWAGDFGDAAFTDPIPGFPFTVSNGILRIEARKGPDGKWRSGLLASTDPQARGFAQRYGYFEMTAKLPKGPGLWPAFWLASAVPQGRKETTVEIDILEQYGKFPADFHSVVHVWNPPGGARERAWQHVTPVAENSLYEGFHRYGADVEPDWITVYFDRKPTWRVATPPEHDKKLLILVDLALGSGWPIDRTPNPSVMEVRGIGVYARGAERRGRCSGQGVADTATNG